MIRVARGGPSAWKGSPAPHHSPAESNVTPIISTAMAKYVLQNHWPTDNPPTCEDKEIKKALQFQDNVETTASQSPVVGLYSTLDSSVMWKARSRGRLTPVEQQRVAKQVQFVKRHQKELPQQVFEAFHSFYGTLRSPEGVQVWGLY